MRVRLVTADLETVDAALAGDDALASALGAEVAEDWQVFPGALDHVRAGLVADPASARWGTRLFVAGEPPALVGWGGFKGAPADGVVELGYAVAPAWRERGIATAATTAMLDEAFADPEVRAVIAHTLAEPNASTRVLERAGFVREAEIEDPEDGRVWRWSAARPRR